MFFIKMKFINIYNIEDIQHFSDEIKFNGELYELIDKYATLNDYTYICYINDTQVIIPFTIYDNKYCFYAVENIFENKLAEIQNKILCFDINKLVEINKNSLLTLLQDTENLSAYIINGKFYE